MAEITFIQGEAEVVTFNITDSVGDVIDVSSAILSFEVAKKVGACGKVITKSDSDFNKTQASTGIVSIDLSAIDTNQGVADYIGELTITFNVNSIKKTQYSIRINKEV